MPEAIDIFAVASTPNTTVIPGGVVIYGQPQVNPADLASGDSAYVAATQLSIAGANMATQAGIASVNASVAAYRAEMDWNAAVFGHKAMADANYYGSDRQLEGLKYNVTTTTTASAAQSAADRTNQLALMNLQMAGKQYTDDRNLEGLKYQVDKTDATNRVQITTVDQRQMYQIDQDVATKLSISQTNKDTAFYQADRDEETRKYGADQQYGASKYGADQDLKGIEEKIQAEKDLLNTKLVYADGKFNLVFPVVSQSLGSGVTTPGLSMVAPQVAGGVVLSPSQVQQQVNAAWAKNDSRTSAQILQTQKELVGRGFSSNSPLLEALKTGYVGQNLRSNVEAATQIRIEAAKVNADAEFNASKANADVFVQTQQVLVESEKNQVTRQVGVIGALAQMISGIT